MTSLGARLEASTRTSASNGVCNVVMRAESVVDAVLSAATCSTLKTTELGDRAQVMEGLNSVGDPALDPPAGRLLSADENLDAAVTK